MNGIGRRGFLRLASAAVGGLALGAPGRAAAGERVAVVSPDGLRLRAGPGRDAPVLDVLAPATQLDRTGPTRDGWTPVRIGATDGWVADAYLGPAPDAPEPSVGGLASGQRAEVATDALTVRAGPGVEQPRVGGLLGGARVDLLGRSGAGWWRVATESLVGHVAARYLSATGEPAAARVFDLDLPIPYHRQLTPVWCDPADVEMWREYRTGQAAPSSYAFQQGIWDWELAHNAGFTVEQWNCSPYAVASALGRAMPDRAFDHFVYDDPRAALRLMAWLVAHPAHREPSVALIWRGDHYVLVRGVRATADPATDPDARLLGLYVADPNQGRPSYMGQDRFVPTERWLGELLTPVSYLTHGSGVPGDVWQGRYVAIQRSWTAGPTPAGRRNATPAEYG